MLWAHRARTYVVLLFLVRLFFWLLSARPLLAQTQISKPYTAFAPSHRALCNLAVRAFCGKFGSNECGSKADRQKLITQHPEDAFSEIF
jgi:hypothetical protein